MENRQAEFLARLADQQRPRAEITQPTEEAGIQERGLGKSELEGERTPENRASLARMMTYDGTGSWLEYEAHFEEYCGLYGWDDARKGR